MKWTVNLWTPYVGERFAIRLGSAVRLRSIRIVIIVVGVLISIPYRFWPSNFGAAVVIVDVTLVLGAFIALTVAISSKINSVSKEVGTLTKAKLGIESLPNLRSTSRYLAWCQSEDVSPATVKTLIDEHGRLRGMATYS